MSTVKIAEMSTLKITGCLFSIVWAAVDSGYSSHQPPFFPGMNEAAPQSLRIPSLMPFSLAVYLTSQVTSHAGCLRGRCR
mmetsp:Transcript_93275/g.204150  ORF Transcript_93275/g.204150 Transcript_93275/m.204150 type:complete len:80 (+) Transcript_93275:86-325(+)